MPFYKAPVRTHLETCKVLVNHIQEKINKMDMAHRNVVPNRTTEGQQGASGECRACP